VTHQTIVLRLGAGDRGAVRPTRPDSVVSEIPFLDLFDAPLYGVASVLAQLSRLGLTPTPMAFDLLMLATAVTAADTRISRQQHAENRWTREIELWLPVNDPSRWETQSGRLASMLKFLTGDIWRLVFRPRPQSDLEMMPPSETLRLIEPTCVSLFSGGLDSFIGAIDLLMCHERPILVSHWWDSHASRHQSDCLRALQDRFDDEEFWHLRAHVGVDQETLVESTIENTQRGRSFMFFALAVLAASAIGDGTPILVPENGLISLNVPLDPLRVGALSTRTTHPYYMAEFNEVLAGLGIYSRLENPYRHKTKGEMVHECLAPDFLAARAHLTMSCSSESKYRRYHDPRRRMIGHCGYCVPCLIRRASLQAGLGGDGTRYWLDDLRQDPIDSNTAVGADIRAFQLALERLRRDPSRARFDIHIPGPLRQTPKDLLAYEGVYRRGMEEVAHLLQGVVARPLSS
jgi:7-cyano-7-deazaguanine synthase in queuosine biosynthesis